MKYPGVARRLVSETIFLARVKGIPPRGLSHALFIIYAYDVFGLSHALLKIVKLKNLSICPYDIKCDSFSGTKLNSFFLIFLIIEFLYGSI